MLKKTLAWVLTLTLLLGTVSGLALITSADETGFAYASYISGEPLYKNATQNLYTNGAMSMPIAPRNAVYLANQNTQVGISVPASAGLGSNVTVEIKFQGTADNTTKQSGTRLGMNYARNGGQSDYGQLRLMGYQGMEELNVDATEVELEGEYTLTPADADGWRVLSSRWPTPTIPTAASSTW